MNESIITFLKKQTCTTICGVDESDKPFCFTCFYAFDSEKQLLYFKSSASSFHSRLLKINPLVAGTILPDKLSTFIVKGVQFDGIVLNEPGLLSEKASLQYHKRHPLALAISGETWTVQINRVKMTDSSRSFGKKIIWNREDGGL